ncbi:unnamed protein product [Nippostrongylus brasiliensis]|uniref:Secreted protein n=1 Tax=Nippostrongylus brasiliensis TaxID=27835 RepID=A0A0N4YME3_NIPBR|nr:unnamed protein product [Nippostrongylus brasiliensis]
MLLKVALVALVFVAVHGQAMPHGPINGRQRRSSEPLSDSDKKRLEEIQEKVAEAMKMVEKYKKN